jgi:hypothetical protein
VAIAGCTNVSTYEPYIQSNFAYPNSNIYDMTPTSGTASKTYFFAIPSLTDAYLTEAAIADALKKAGGDRKILIDGDYRAELKIFPFLPIYTVTAVVTGNAGKVELGRRDLGGKVAVNGQPVKQQPVTQ